MCQYLVADYDCDASAVWSDVATFGVRPTGWREAAGPYGKAGSHRSVADITGPESLAEVRAYKQQAKQAARAAEPAADK